MKILITIITCIISATLVGQITFEKSPHNFANVTTPYVSCGDIDNDGDIDLLDNEGLWINNGKGVFSKSNTDSLPLYGKFYDLNSDGYLDIFNLGRNYTNGEPNEVWLNNKNGTFRNTGQLLGHSVSYDAGFADFDNDGDIDVFVCNHVKGNTETDGGHKLWLNDGYGNFTDSGQDLGNGWNTGMDTGDIDNDGDIDVVISSNDGNEYNMVWINENNGVFTKGQTIGTNRSMGLKLGDLDGNGYLDIFITHINFFGATNNENRVWMNNGDGTFTDSGQLLGNSKSSGVDLADIDNDGDLDAIVANGYYSAVKNIVWINDGNGNFTESNAQFGTEASMYLTTSELNGDDKLDIVVANFDAANSIWFNTSNIASISNEYVNTIKLYPNPAKTYLKIKEISSHNINYKIMGYNGFIFKEGNVNSDIINISDLMKGVYFIQLKINNEQITEKFIVDYN